MMKLRKKIVVLVLTSIAPFVSADTKNKTSDIPDAPKRTNAKNYKDMVLAYCISDVYKNDPNVSKDASSTGSAIVEWTSYDAEHSVEEMNALIKKYTDRTYHHPLVEYKGIEFGLLKCLDMYHSKELDMQVKKYVSKPNWVFDKPVKGGVRK